MGVDVRIAELADRQHGRVARWQLLEIGIGRGAIDLRVANSRLRPVHPGVYAVGSRLWTREAAWMSAALAGGPNALVSHRDAGLIRRLVRGGVGRVHVTTTDRGRSGCRGIRLHRVRGLDQRDRDCVDGIPVTSVARTLLDIAASLPHDRLIAAVEVAVDLHLFHLPEIDDLLERSRGRAGARALRQALEAYRPEPAFLRSDVERDFLTLCKRAGLPRPSMNLNVLGHEVDALWEEQQLIVEVDTFGTHSSRASFERDRRRDAELQLAGYRVIRITDLQLRGDPEGVATLLRDLLA